MSGQLELFKEHLPHKPYATDDLAAGVKIQYKQKAITKRYLQHNPPSKVHWIVLDCDKSQTYEMVGQERTVPPPNFEVINRVNGHSHLFYGLVTPVTKTNLAHAKPLNYLASVSYALREMFEADEGYQGNISKNPLHAHWQLIERRQGLWELGELAEYLVLPVKLPKKAYEVGIGRNCSMFETVRLWAYKKVKEYRAMGGPEETRRESFYTAVHLACIKLNSFPEPLSLAEIRAIAKSVGRWTWKHYNGRWADEAFSQRQAARAYKGAGVPRYRHTPEERAQAVQEARQPGVKAIDVAKAHNIGYATLKRWLAKPPDIR